MGFGRTARPLQLARAQRAVPFARHCRSRVESRREEPPALPPEVTVSLPKSACLKALDTDCDSLASSSSESDYYAPPDHSTGAPLGGSTAADTGLSGNGLPRGGSLVAEEFPMQD